MSYTRKLIEKELSRAGTERAEGEADTLHGICLGMIVIIVIQPATLELEVYTTGAGMQRTHMSIKTMPRDQMSAAQRV